MMGVARVHGTVKNYDWEKGFGFIIPDAGGADVFVHYKSLVENKAYKCLEVGEYVEYRPDWDPEKERVVACEVTGQYGTPLLCSAGPPKNKKGKGFVTPGYPGADWGKGGKDWTAAAGVMAGKDWGPAAMAAAAAAAASKGKGKAMKGKGKGKGKPKGITPYGAGWDPYGWAAMDTSDWGMAAVPAVPSAYDPCAAIAWKAVMGDPNAAFWKAIAADPDAVSTWKAIQQDPTHVFWQAIASDPTTAVPCVDYPALAAAAAITAMPEAPPLDPVLLASMPDFSRLGTDPSIPLPQIDGAPPPIAPMPMDGFVFPPFNPDVPPGDMPPEQVAPVGSPPGSPKEDAPKIDKPEPVAVV